MSKIKLSKEFIKSTVKLALNEDLYPSGDITSSLIKDDKIVIGNTIKLTLACDHRTVDGVTGSLFLETLKGYVENPVTMLV